MTLDYLAERVPEVREYEKERDGLVAPFPDGVLVRSVFAAPDAALLAVQEYVKGLEAQNERLRCCGSCFYCGGIFTRCRQADFMGALEAKAAGWDRVTDLPVADVFLGDHCHFTPSRWTRREK